MIKYLTRIIRMYAVISQPVMYAAFVMPIIFDESEID